MRLRFDDIELDSDRREVRRGGEVVALTRKPYELLLVVLQERHRVVPYREVMARVWPDVHVSSVTLASTLRDLRRAIGDQGYHPRFIETVRGEGLRFLGSVEEVEPAFAAPDSDGLFESRKRLVAQLCAALDAVRAGRGRVVLIAGEAGMGKTRIGCELAEQARARGFSVQIGHCADSVLDPPYGVWVQILTGLIESRPRPEIDAALEGVSAELVRIVPAIGDRQPDAIDRSIPSGYLDAGVRLLDRVGTFLRRLARSAPTLLVIDDLDRAGRSSLQVLEFLAGRIADAPLLLVGTYRPEALGGHPALARTIAELGRVAPCDRYHLEALTRDEVREFLQRCTGTAPASQTCAELHERSGGNALFLRELVRHELGPGGARGAATQQRELPPTLRDAIVSRVLTLSETAQRLLASAALLGREFSVGVVASVADLAESAVFEALEEARRAGIAEPGPRGHWRFVHALVLEAIAGELAPVLRMQLHGRIGEVLGAEVDQGDGARALEVAHHLSRAAERLMLQAAEAAARAARHAERSLAFADAASAYESALELRSRAGADDPAERCELLLGLAQARLSARDVQGAWESARRAAELAREIASPVQLARAALVLGAHFHIGFEAPLALLEEVLPALPADAPALRSAVLSTITAQLHYARQPKRRIELAEQSLEAARRAGSPEIVALALMAMRNALCAPEAISVRLQVGSERVEWADRVPHSAQRCLARGERAVDRYAAGDIDAAEQDVVDIERIAREIPVRSMQSFPARWRCLRANAEGRFADAETAARAAFELTRQADDPNAIPNLTMQLGMVRYEQGRWEELDAMVAGASGWLAPYRAVAPAVRACLANFELLRGRCDAALADYRHLVGDEFAALDGDPEPLVTSSWLAGMMRRLGDAERAERLYERLSSYGDQFVIFNFAVAARGSFARYLGLLAHAAGRFEDAERHLERAIAANQRIGATLYVARARADEAALLAARGAPGDRERSIELERAARSAFERFGVRESGRAPGV